jgi:hypothetical protein
MKKLSMLLVVLSSVVLFSCKDKKEEQLPMEPKVESAPEATPPKAEEETGTTIKVNKDGMEFSDEKTKIEISKDGGEVKKN